MCACQLGLHFMVSCSVLNNLSVVGLTMQTTAASGRWYFAHQPVAGENAIPAQEWQKQSRRSVIIMMIEPLRKSWRINALHWVLCALLDLSHGSWCLAHFLQFCLESSPPTQWCQRKTSCGCSWCCPCTSFSDPQTLAGLLVVLD